MSKIKFIIFDFDGVINDLNAAKIKTIKDLFGRFRIIADNYLIFSILNYIEQAYETQRTICYYKLISSAIDKLIRNKLLDINEEQQKYFVENFEPYLKRNTCLDKELIEKIKRIKNKNKLTVCLYTSQPPLYISEVLRSLKIEKNFFDYIYTLQDFDEPKPSIKNLEEICRRLKFNPRNGLIIGDNVSVDLMPAKFLGMTTVLYSKLVDYLFFSSNDLIKYF